MDSFMIGILGIVFLVVLLALGVHIAVVLAVVGLFGLAVILGGVKPAAVTAVNTIYYKATTYNLLTVPCFIFMGFLAAGGGVSIRLYEFLRLWLGRLRSSLAIATVLGCTAFGAVCGSSLVTSAVFAKISAPEMIRYGYDKKLAYGICAGSGIIGMMIPPSVLAIVYGMLTGLSIGELLIAGIGPGILLAILFSAGLVIMSKVRPNLMPPVPMEGITWHKRFAAIPPTWPVIIVAAVMFGGIFTGIFSPTEAAAVATFAILVIVLAIRPGHRMGTIMPAFRDSATSIAMVFLILTCAQVFATFLSISGLTGKAVEYMLTLDIPPLAFVGLFILLYLALGTIIDSISMFAITIPIVSPVIASVGLDPIWFAMVAIVASQIGTITPPMGLCVFAAKAVAGPDVSTQDVFAGSFPFFLMELVVLGVMVAFPVISTFFPSLMIKPV
jgi:tripartite ATP-independent transporter DctM subunit